MKKMILLGLLLGFMQTGFSADPSVKYVVAEQQPDSKVVVIRYTVEDRDGDKVDVSMKVMDGDTEISASSLSGDIGEGIRCGRGNVIEWDAGADWNGNISSNVVFEITVDDGTVEPGEDYAPETMDFSTYSIGVSLPGDNFSVDWNSTTSLGYSKLGKNNARVVFVENDGDNFRQDLTFLGVNSGLVVETDLDSGGTTEGSFTISNYIINLSGRWTAYGGVNINLHQSGVSFGGTGTEGGGDPEDQTTHRISGTISGTSVYYSNNYSDTSDTNGWSGSHNFSGSVGVSGGSMYGTVTGEDPDGAYANEPVSWSRIN